MKQSIYTDPKLCKSSQGWYVYFYFNKKQKRYKLGINRIKNEREREKEARVLISVLKEKLSKGWSPFSSIPVTEKILFTEALKFALSKKRLSKKSYSMYSGTVNFITEATEYLMIDYLRVDEVKRAHVKQIMEKAKESRDWSNNAYNKHLNHLKSLFTELLEWDFIEHNPCHGIKSLKVNESTRNNPATPQQRKLIKTYLQNQDPNFLRFVEMIFHTGIRPKELLLIQIKHIDFVNKVIIIPPEISKTEYSRIVPFNVDWIEKHPEEYYLFGSFRERGKGNIGKFEDFICAPTPIKRDTATKRWNKLVKKHLGIEVTLYSNKHAGADAKIKAGVSLDALRHLYGHRNKRMTEVYAKAVKEVYRKEIQEKSVSY